MDERRTAYLPQDRLVALSRSEELPFESEGSVLFADISGFTPLTEAFQSHLGSRKGGEQLTRILNEVYAMLICEVDRLRGSVIGFAGDAITCWFADDRGERAVNAGLAMQAGMSAFAEVPSPDGGSIALGLKAVVTTGRVKRFTIGREEVQRADVLVGAPVYRVAEVEALAERGEVLVDTATRDALSGRLRASIGRKDTSGQVIGWVVEAMDPVTGVEPWPELASFELDRSLVDPWMIAPIRERLASGLGAFFTELRPATTLFLRFGGIDFDGDPEAKTHLDTFYSEVQRIVAGYDGVVHQLTIGDKGSFLYAAFGAPISHEDDTARALAAALELRSLPEAIGGIVDPVQIGMGRGVTRTGAYGGPTRRTYGVLGDQVNLAARLMAKAAPGEVLVSESVADEGEKGFYLTTLSPVRVKGKSEPIALFRLESAKDRAAKQASSYAHPMIGRKAERELVASLYDPVCRGEGQCVSLAADVGMGKTRFLHEVIDGALERGFRIFGGECQAFGTNTLYTPWWSICREFFGITEVEAAEDRIAEYLKQIRPELVLRMPVLSSVLNIPMEDSELTRMFDMKLRRASMESLLIECLRWEARHQPLLIHIEDAQAIDSGSRDLLRTVVQAISQLPVLIIITQRPCSEGTVLGADETALSYNHQLSFGEFSDEEAAELIQYKYHQLFETTSPLPDAVVAQISSRTGNSPFFIDEVMNLLHREGIDILAKGALEGADLPDSLYSLVLSRMDQLDESARVSMKVASVIGRLFRAAVIWGVSPELGGRDAVLSALDRLAQQDFTVQEESESELVYLFRHVVIHEVAYESLPHELRERLHEAIGSYIEAHYEVDTTQILDLLAFHFGRSTNLEKQRMYYRLAGDAAQKAYANTTATRYYEALIPLIGETEQVPVKRKLGLVKQFSGDWEGAMESFQSALAIADAHGLKASIARIELDIGDLLRRRGEFEEAQVWLKRSREVFSELDDVDGLGQALHSSGTLAAQTGNYDQAKALYGESMQLRKAQGNDSKVASLLSNLGIIVRFQGDVDQALELQEESLALRRDLNDAWAIGNSLNNLGMAKRYKGDLTGAREHLEEALKLLKNVGDRAEIANTLNSLAEVALDQKDTEACETFLEESLHLTRELGNLRGLAFIFEAFAANALFQERPRRSLRLFGAASALRQSIGAPLPDSDSARIEEMMQSATLVLEAEEARTCIAEGEAFSLMEALSFASEGTRRD
jgi:adenylate cyclase